MQNGSQYKANDFLYGMLFDPLHVNEEFDKFMGKESWRTFSEWQDRLFIDCLLGQTIPSEDVKQIMNILPDFLNKKMNCYLSHGLIDQAGANAIIGNFNRIWNSMQREYGVYFSQREINKIGKRARS